MPSRINVISGEGSLFLVTTPRLECYAASHFTPKATAYVMTQTGDIWQVIDQIGQPYRNFEERVNWDGEKWRMLSHQTDVHWGGTSEEFSVWHIVESEDGWYSLEYELEDTTSTSTI